MEFSSFRASKPFPIAYWAQKLLFRGFGFQVPLLLHVSHSSGKKNTKSFNSSITHSVKSILSNCPSMSNQAPPRGGSILAPHSPPQNPPPTTQLLCQKTTVSSFNFMNNFCLTKFELVLLFHSNQAIFCRKLEFKF